MSSDPLFTYSAAMEAELASVAAAVDMDVDFDASRLQQEIAACSAELWGVPQLRPRQLATATALLNPLTPDRTLYVDGTGAGKSHAMRVLGGMLGGVTIVFIPLLSLSADVLEKFKTSNDTFGEVNVSHLDELYEVSRQKYESVLA